jgi:hypothetical protein
MRLPTKDKQYAIHFFVERAGEDRPIIRQICINASCIEEAFEKANRFANEHWKNLTRLEMRIA